MTNPEPVMDFDDRGSALERLRRLSYCSQNQDDLLRVLFPESQGGAGISLNLEVSI